MKRLFVFPHVLVCFLFFHVTVTAQIGTNPYVFYVGKSDNFFKELGLQAGNGRVGELTSIDLKVSPSQIFNGKVNFKTLTSGGQSIAGSLKGVSGASFFITIKGKAVEGNIILRDTKQAYQYSSDQQGNMYVTEVDINKVLCIDYLKTNTVATAARQNAPGTIASIGPAVSNLQSYPGAQACVYLDFDGYFYQGSYWNSGNPINALPSALNDAQVQEAWELTSEDYGPFNLNITTSETVFNSYPVNRRQRCVITPTNDAQPGSGGVAYVDLFGYNDVPCWVFTNSAKSVGEAISHEVGHNMGLSHDGRTTPVEEYFAGQGSYGPIMGVGYYKPIIQWSKGEYANANNLEDDVTIISRASRAQNRPDEHGNTTATATPLQIDVSGNVSASLNFGIIGKANDIDMFSFSTVGGNTSLNFNPAPRHGNLDILATLYNSSGGVVATSDPAGLAAVINTILIPGTYYVSIDGTGAGDPVTNGYSDYGSLGFFSISGTVVPTPPTNKTPVVSLTSPTSGAIFTSPTTVALAANASDPDGTISRVEFFYGTTKIGEDLTQPYSFSWTNVTTGTYSITAKATDNQGSQAVSTSVSIQVKVNLPPTISITSPQQNAIVAVSSTMDIHTTASDADGSISKVEFFNGAVKLGESLTSPYNFSWNNVLYGSYTIVAKATDNLGATASAQVKVVVDYGPIANAGKDDTLALPGNSLFLRGSGSTTDGTSVSFAWAQLSGPDNALFSSNSISSPEASNLVLGVYVFELTVTNLKGLTARDQVSITVMSPSDISRGVIPRFFSPNGDGNNDLWEWPNIELYANSKLTIFNQSGQNIYLTESYDNTWDGKVDGKALSENAYYYVIQFKNNEKITGAVRIIR